MRQLKTYALLVIALFCYAPAYSQEQEVTVTGDTLVLKNNVTTHRYLVNNGNLSLIDIYSVKAGILKADKPEPDLVLTGEPLSLKASIEINNVKATQYNNAYTEAVIISSAGTVEVKRVVRLYEGSAAVQHIFYLRGKAQSIAWSAAQDSSHKMIEANVADRQESRMGMLNFNTRGWKFKSVLLHEATDYHDNPVTENEFISFSKKKYVQGNVLIAKNTAGNNAIFILKESPITYSQHYYHGYDFSVDYNSMAIYGIGIEPKDLSTEWIRGYGFGVGLCSKDDYTKHLLLYQLKTTKYNHNRDFMFMSNTWGDRSKDSRMNESFMLQEINTAAQLGITHVQLDDGWQQGLSENSASKAGKKWDDWQIADWQVHKQRFPNGFKTIIAEANKHNIRLGLWFNPSKKDNYANWKRDADILLGYYKKYGIKVFKIDGMDITGKMAEVNLRSFFDEVKKGSEGEVVFNLDVTAGKRMGYHYFTEYGNIFLENRYTDWANYYPWHTLRNLWQLARYMPLQRLQSEFLNVSRNTNKYKKDDATAPAVAGIEFAFSATLFAQPLAWMELSALPHDSAEKVKAMAQHYTPVANSIHNGIILPMGNEPDGQSFTGFLSIGNEGVHYLAVYREHCDSNNYTYTLPFSVSAAKPVFGSAMQFSFKGNELTVQSSKKWDYAIFKLISE